MAVTGTATAVAGNEATSFHPNPVFAAGGTTIFEVMSLLAKQHEAINLGQGFPDHGEPQLLLQAAADAILAGPNQYPPMLGLPVLRQAIAAHARRFQGLTLDPDREVLVTSGATEALADTFLALLQPGDEAIVIEPLYDAYPPLIRRAGATVKTVRLEPPHWQLDPAKLAAAIGPNTRAIVLNNPMNPNGKLFTPAEIDAIAAAAVQHNLVVIADEVYEQIVFDGGSFRSVLTHPDLRQRAVRIGSAGKSFSLTGWKVGYVSAAPHLLQPIAKCHQFVTFTTPPHLQQAVAVGLGLDDAFFAELPARLQAKRDRLADGLRRVGFEVLPAAGAYFLVCRFDQLSRDQSDLEFCKTLTVDCGVAAIPVSAFYDAAPRTDLVRFCFCKKDEVLDQAIERLVRLLG